MNLEERVINGLVEEGYGNVYTQYDEPEKVYDEHTHAKDTAHIVIKGELELTMDEKVYVLRKGDRCDIPKDTPHHAKIGTEGCTYVIGEK